MENATGASRLNPQKRKAIGIIGAIIILFIGFKLGFLGTLLGIILAIYCLDKFNVLSAKSLFSGLGNNKKRYFLYGLLFVCLILLGASLFGNDNKSNSQSTENQQPTPDTAQVQLGEDGIVTINKDINDCTGTMLLPYTKDALDKIQHAASVNDNIGLYEAVVKENGASLISNCTKVKVIDSTIFLRQIRVLEGVHATESGWVPFEWVKKK